MQLSNQCETLDSLLDDSETMLLVRDTNTFVLRYLHKRKFRNVKVYYVADVPVFNPSKYATVKCPSEAEAEALMIVAASSVI